MDLKTHYDNLYKRSIQKFSSQGVEVDNNIDNPYDTRYGLTLIVQPEEKVRKKILQFIARLSKIDPLQYYYPFSDIHITVLSIISCIEGLQLENIKVQNYLKLIEHQLDGLKKFRLKMEGVTASPSCIMICGYPAGGTLNEMRNRLRSAFEQTDLEQSIDQRYLLQTAHATVVRFRQPIAQKRLFLEKMEMFKNQCFGVFEVEKIDLVYNDWYHRRERIQRLHSFNLDFKV